MMDRADREVIPSRFELVRKRSWMTGKPIYRVVDGDYDLGPFTSEDEARDYVIRTFGKDRMDRIFDPSSPIELCQCGSLLEPTDPDECFECRRKKAEVVSIPVWPLVLVVLILVGGSALLIPLTYSTWRIVAGR